MDTMFWDNFPINDNPIDSASYFRNLEHFYGCYSKLTVIFAPIIIIVSIYFYWYHVKPIPNQQKPLEEKIDSKTRKPKKLVEKMYNQKEALNNRPKTNSDKKLKEDWARVRNRYLKSKQKLKLNKYKIEEEKAKKVDLQPHICQGAHKNLMPIKRVYTKRNDFFDNQPIKYTTKIVNCEDKKLIQNAGVDSKQKNNDPIVKRVEKEVMHNIAVNDKVKNNEIKIVKRDEKEMKQNVDVDDKEKNDKTTIFTEDQKLINRNVVVDGEKKFIKIRLIKREDMKLHQNMAAGDKRKIIKIKLVKREDKELSQNMAPEEMQQNYISKIVKGEDTEIKQIAIEDDKLKNNMNQVENEIIKNVTVDNVITQNNNEILTTCQEKVEIKQSATVDNMEKHNLTQTVTQDFNDEELNAVVDKILENDETEIVNKEEPPKITGFFTEIKKQRKVNNKKKNHRIKY